MKILVTGGAGYIGSHMVRTLGEVGHEVVALDSLATGRRDAVLCGRLVVADLSDTGRIDELLSAEKFDAVIHFAAYISVEESVSNPLKYYLNNFTNTLTLIEACVRHDIRRFIFSSTAAVYGIPEKVPTAEDAAIMPVNPYGFSKAMAEQVLKDVSLASGLRYVSLRYFNVVGADSLARIGESHRDATHLITLCLRTALGLREHLEIFGTDYDTPDGTCIRDYIHVDDLADAHMLALDHLQAGGPSRIFNCGYGRGYSVREVVDEVRKVTGVDFRVEAAKRRKGDAPVLVADPSLISRELDWRPSRGDLSFIIKTAWEWEKKFQGMNPGS